MVKGNPNHDPKNGEFTSGSSGNQKMNDAIRNGAGVDINKIVETGLDIFKIYDKDGTVMGSVIVRHNDRSSIPYVYDILVYKEYRGQGLGRKLLKYLLDKYGAIRSSDSGTTSDDASKMWKSLGARTLLTSDRGYGDSFYVLEKK